MIAVMFEVVLREGQADRYLQLAAQLRPLLERIDGFISIERFRSLAEPGRLLSLSFWRDEAAVARWRQLEAHRAAQQEGARMCSPTTGCAWQACCATTACAIGGKRPRTAGAATARLASAARLRRTGAAARRRARPPAAPAPGRP